MVTRRELVNRCLPLYDFLEPTDSLVDDEDSLKGLFADLRGEPDTLARLLEGVPDAEEIQQRFAWLTEGLPRRGLYAIPTAATQIDRRETEAWVRAHYDALVALLREAGHSAEADELAVERAYEWRKPGREEALDDYFDEYGDYVGDALDESHPAASLHEAAYGLAAVYEVSWYLLWPVYQKNVATADPFRSAAALWKAGIQWVRTLTSVLVWPHASTSGSD